MQNASRFVNNTCFTPSSPPLLAYRYFRSPPPLPLSLPLQHNKQREELQRLKQKYPEKAAQLEAKYTRQHNKAQANDDEEDSSSSSSDDDDDDNPRIPAKVDAKIFETLMKIRNKDESIYNKEAKFFSSDDEEDDDDDDDEDGAPTNNQAAAAAAAVKKDKPMYLKDVIYQQALADQEQGGSSDSEDEDHNNDKDQSTYTEEQKHIKDELLKAFHQAAEEVDGEDTLGGVLQRRGSTKKIHGDNGNTDAHDGHMSDDKVQSLLNKYFGDKDDQLEAGDRFLKRYMLNRGWVDKDGDSSDDDDGHGYGGRSDRGDMHKQQPDVEEDEAYLEAAEQFEHTYNFRFEEPGGNILSTHPRQIEGTVRKEDDRRKQKRKEKKERLQAEEEKRRAELRRLKNLKKAEIGDKLKEIQKVAGKAAPQEDALDAIMAGEFDPEAYDKAMAAAFGDNYYGAADEEFGSGGEDDDEGEEEDDDDEMVDKAFEKYLRQMASYGTDDEDEDDQPASTAEAVAGGGNTFAALQKKLHHTGDGTVIEGSKQGGEVRSRDDVLKLLEEYYKLDYEDVVAGIPTRFRYRSVPKQDFGLGVEDILALDDKELNQVVGLKKLAPYRDDWKKQRANYGALNAIRRDKQQQQRYGGGGGKRNVNDYPGDDGGDDKKKKERPFMSKEEQRLASYAKPSLKRSGGGGDDGDESYHRHDKKKKARTNNNNNNNNNNKGAAGGNNNSNIMDMRGSGGQQLTKAQKKNLKRSMKRASKKE